MRRIVLSGVLALATGMGACESTQARLRTGMPAEPGAPQPTATTPRRVPDSSADASASSAAVPDSGAAPHAASPTPPVTFYSPQHIGEPDPGLGWGKPYSGELTIWKVPQGLFARNVDTQEVLSLPLGGAVTATACAPAGRLLVVPRTEDRHLVTRLIEIDVDSGTERSLFVELGEDGYHPRRSDPRITSAQLPERPRFAQTPRGRFRE